MLIIPTSLSVYSEYLTAILVLGARHGGHTKLWLSNVVVYFAFCSLHFYYYYYEMHGRRGGLMVSALDSGSSGPGSGPGRGHCVVFLGKTLYSHGASLHPGV